MTVRLTGSLAADDKSDVGSNASGIVSETRVERGSFVKKGDLMVQLDPRDSQYALDEGQMAAEQLRVRLGLDEGKKFRVEEVPEVEAASLAFQLAEKNYRRAESLKKANAIAISDADQMETEYRSARQRYQLAVLVAKQLYQSYLRGAVARGDAAEGGGGLLHPGAVRRLGGGAGRFRRRTGHFAVSQRQAGHRAADRPLAAFAHRAAAGNCRGSRPARR